ncbi:uncharacterized protein [Triticum aestivum]|nr:uncharacterized protein LOC123167907 [Triticum aestivum]
MGKRKSSSRRSAAVNSDESEDGDTRWIISPLGPDASRPPAQSRTGCPCQCHQQGTKRKAPGASRRRRNQPDNSTNVIRVYYGHREQRTLSLNDRLSFYRGHNFSGFGHVVVELPQPRPMTLVDLHLWILKLFRLHPETQDLSITGFFKEYTPDTYSDPHFLDQILDWDIRFFTTDRDWSSFVNKMKRKNVQQKFKLFVDCSELKHYDVLLKAVHEDYTPPSTVVLPETKCLLIDDPDHHFHLVEDWTMTPQEIVVYLADNYDKQIRLAEAWRAKLKVLETAFGTFFHSYDSVPGLLQDIACNPGGFVDIKDTEVVGCEDFRVLHRIFWAFAPCIHAFRCCRPVLCVKGTPLWEISRNAAHCCSTRC